MASQKRTRWFDNLLQVNTHFLAEEIKRGSLPATLMKSFKSRTLQFGANVTPSQLLEERARDFSGRTFLLYEGESLTFDEVNEKANRYAHHFCELGCGPGSGIGIMMANSPEYLYAFFAASKIGAYVVPVNTALVDEGLAYILDHSDMELLVLDKEFVPAVSSQLEKIGKIENFLVNGQKSGLKKPFQSLTSADKCPRTQNKDWHADPAEKSVIMYTSGTTGLPKGVVTRYETGLLRKLGLISHLLYNNKDVLYTCLPLFHANALFITMSGSLWLGIPLVLSQRFSASRFWEEIRTGRVTVFNSIGAMIPILMKQPPDKDDKRNSVRLVLSAGCPAEQWEEFETRFGVQIWESYSAIDGGQRFTFNMGTAPVGSIGKPLGAKYRIVNEADAEVPAGETGELVFKTRSGEKAVEYFKNPEASSDKQKDGWLHTGDLVYEDARGFLYFVGRKTESMRRRGENVSEFEVEKVILKHPDVLECAVYGVPSELGEDEIMCTLVRVKGKKITGAALRKWLQGKLAAFAIPRYVRIADELPKTATHRVIKKVLADEGVTADTYDGDPREAKTGTGKKSARKKTKKTGGTAAQPPVIDLEDMVLKSKVLTDTEKLILRRRSTRAFRSRQVPETMLRRILEAGRYAPSAGNCQPWRFIVVRNRKMIDDMEDTIREVLAPIKVVGEEPGLRRNLVVSAVNLVVPRNKGDLRPLGAAKEVVDGRLRIFHDAPCLIIVLKDVRGIDSPDFDTGICSQNMVLAAHAMGICTCYIGFTSFLHRDKKWMKELEISHPWKIVTGICLGYPKYDSEGIVQRDLPQIDWYEKRGERKLLY